MMDNNKINELWRKGYIITSDAIPLLNKVDLKKLLDFLGYKKQKIITKNILEKIINSETVQMETNLNQNKKTIKKTITKKESKIIKPTQTYSLLKFLETRKTKEEVKVIAEKKESNEEVLKVNIKKEVEICYEVRRHIGDELDLKIDVIKNYTLQKENPTIQTWVSYYQQRLKHIRKLLKNHRELSVIYSSDHLRKDMDEVGFIGVLRDKRSVTNGTVFLLEDTKGLVKVFVPNDIPDYEIVKDAPLDSVIGVIGNYNSGRKSIYTNLVLLPDIPYKEKKFINEDIYIAFTGDFQIGNKAFLKDAFEKFINWLKGKNGNEKQKKLASKVGYLILVGDLVDGTGIYPEQEKELEIKDIYKQYEAMEKYLLELPENIQVVIIPGNHDAVRLAEPQPPIPKEFLPNLYRLKNFYILSNPCYVRLHSKINVLVYHGYPMDWFISEISWIRNSGGYENPGNVMKFMLQLRHLCPTHGAIPYIPYKNEDPLVIDPVPDIFVTGHIHRTYVGNYKNVDLINASCFQGITQYQIELGHKPDPGKTVLKNLKTGEFKILSFLN